MIGRTIAHYEILGELGAGGMAVVYLGEGLPLDQLEHQELLAIDFLEAVDGTDVGVIEGGEELGPQGSVNSGPRGPEEHATVDA